MLNAFSIDTEEWFHVCGVETKYSDPASWDHAESHVVEDTGVLLDLLEDADKRATFFCVGWVAERYPELIRRISDAGHEVGCHSYFHRLVTSQTEAEFEEDLVRSLDILREVSGQDVTAYRAPSFSITMESFWAYPVLYRHGIRVDSSLVPARRDNGGVPGVSRDPFLLHFGEASMKCFPLSVMKLAGRMVQFSGGGYLRLLPQAVINAGFRQNHGEGRVGMSYTHPREINPSQPRLKLPPLKRFKYYFNLKSTRPKLRQLLETFEFTTVREVMESIEDWPDYSLAAEGIVPLQAARANEALGTT